MKTKIYWFSGTGNSYHVAKSIQEGLEDAELIPIARAIKGEIEYSERTGLVFPVYAWGPPVIVSKFIEKLPSHQPEYLFAVATYGGSPGSTMAITKKMLGREGLRLDASFTVGMVENYPPMGGAPAEEKQNKILAQSKPEIEMIVAGVKENAIGVFGRNNFFFAVMGRMVYPLFRIGLSRQKGSKFYADEKCTSCGICVKICPVKNIELAEGEKPAWSTHCEQCFACLHWCPEKAIEYGKKSLSQPRYHHPETSLAEMMVD